MIEWVPRGHTIKHQYYIEVPRKLTERVRKKRKDLQSNNTWILNQDNVPMHIALPLPKTVLGGQTHYCARGSTVLPRSRTI
ncbi:hypothetical protein TNCV_3312331 [Trichonephila clavipes]|nr:hypothetical protein TNCV_3312331 [Trichonephila clavipes]